MIGHIHKDLGLLINNQNYKVVKKVLQPNENIQKHNHPAENVIFIVTTGNLNVTLNEIEHHNLVSGIILSFDGTNYIQAVANEYSEVIVILVKK